MRASSSCFRVSPSGEEPPLESESAGLQRQRVEFFLLLDSLVVWKEVVCLAVKEV